jgi:hypothetical protein
MIIRGRVIDTSGLGIPGALVHDGRNGITANDDGTFEFESTEQFISAVMVGFEEVQKPAAPHIEFMLIESDNSMLNAVEIIAFKAKANPIVTTSVIILLLMLLYQFL